MDFRFRLYFFTNPTFKNPLQNHSSYSLVEAVFFEKSHFLKTQFKVCFFCNRLFYSFIIIICICLLSYMPFTIYAFYHVCLFPHMPFPMASQKIMQKVVGCSRTYVYVSCYADSRYYLYKYI